MKKCLFVLFIIQFVMLFSFIASAAITLTDDNVDSYVGRKIIDENAVVDIDSNRMNKKPYKGVFQNWNESGGCVDYVCARHWEKLKITYLVNGSTGNGKDCVKNHINGKKMTSMQTGITYTVHTYFNDNGVNIKENSWVSFESSTSKYGHVVFVEYVKIDSNGVKQIYYTENVNAGVLKKASLEQFVSGNLSSSAQKYLGTAWYESDNTSKQQQKEYSTVPNGKYYINNSGFKMNLVNDKQAIDSINASNLLKQNNMVFEVKKDGNWYKIFSNSSSNGYVLNVWTSGSSSNGNEVTLYKNTGNPSQRWYFEECNGGYLIHPADNVSLSLTRDTSTNKIYVKTTTKGSNQIWTLESADHVHSYSTKYESTHPHREYKICDCGEKEYTGKTRMVDDCEDCHVHSYTTKYESAHPHKQYKVCDCGDEYYTGNTRTVDSCEICNPPEECRHSVQTIYFETKHPHKEYGICDECGEKKYTGKTGTDDNCDQCHEHSYTTKYESSHPHKQYKICDCGDKYYTGDTKAMILCDDCHEEHNYKIKYDSSHPHKQYKVCDECGDMYYTEETRIVESCKYCNRDKEMFEKYNTSISKSVTVTIPTFPVTINGVSKNNTYAKYPYIVYNDITYFPMTYNGARFLKLKCDWTKEKGLVISKSDTVASSINENETQSTKNSESYTAATATGIIIINGEYINNSEETYPIIMFRDVTYFPLTWRFAVTEFGWDYSFSNRTGLVINSK